MREIANIAVEELMAAPVVTVTPATTLQALTELMKVHDYNGFPVVDEAGILQGLVTRLDLFKIYLLPYRTLMPQETWLSSVGAIMSRGAVVLHRRESALRAVELMVEHRLRTIPVVTDDGKGQSVVGVVTRRNLAAALQP